MHDLQNQYDPGILKLLLHTRIPHRFLLYSVDSLEMRPDLQNLLHGKRVNLHFVLSEQLSFFDKCDLRSLRTRLVRRRFGASSVTSTASTAKSCLEIAHRVLRVCICRSRIELVEIAGMVIRGPLTDSVVGVKGTARPA